MEIRITQGNTEIQLQIRQTGGEQILTACQGFAEQLQIPEGVTAIAPFACSEHRELLHLSLPDSLQKIGAHAFYNCRSLTDLSFADHVSEIADGAFKNCSRLTQLHLKRQGGKTRCLKEILSDFNQEVQVELEYPDGTARLVFPFYIYNYEENTPARIVNQITEGAGVQYQECIGAQDVDYPAYDRMFAKAVPIDVQEASWKIACARLLFPYHLAEKAEQKYHSYLLEHLSEIEDTLMAENRLQELEQFLQLSLYDSGTIRTAIEKARSNGYMDCLSRLLAYQKEKYGTGRKKYEF